MRVAIIKSNYTPYGGGEKYATRMIRAFAERNIEVDLLTAASGRWGQTLPEARLVFLKQINFNHLLRVLTFDASAEKYLRKVKYDCIFGMDRTSYQTHLRAGGGLHAGWLAKRSMESSLQRRISFKVNPFHHAMLNIERKAFLSPHIRKIFCNSHFVENEIAEYYPGALNKVTVIHNGVEWGELSEAFSEAEEKKQSILNVLGLHADRYYLLFLGSGYERKGLRKVINALNLLPDHVDLLVVGKDRNERAYKAFAERSGLGKRVHFFGPKQDVIPFLQVANAFILPTIYDPFSNASLEALAMGLYLVTSSANGCCEVMEEGAGCVIRDLQDNASVAEAIGTALKDHLSRDRIRESVKSLDFTTQLNKIVDVCIEDCKK